MDPDTTKESTRFNGPQGGQGVRQGSRVVSARSRASGGRSKLLRLATDWAQFSTQGSADAVFVRDAQVRLGHRGAAGGFIHLLAEAMTVASTEKEQTMLAMVKKFLKNEEGLETVEYAVMAALIVVGLVLAISTLGGSVKNKFVALDDAVNGK
jgi:pilus assembly protein Flp/PilA